MTARAVLEASLRRICEERRLELPPKPGIEKLSTLLRKATPSQYARNFQTLITAWADIRNDAAHAKWMSSRTIR